MLIPLQAPTEPLNPPFPAPLPLWLALLLKKQRRANISPPPWLTATGLSQILEFETDVRTAAVLSPPPTLQSTNGVAMDEDPYLSHSTLELSSPFLIDASTTRAQVDALPYHWLELGHLLLTHAADDFDDPDTVRRLLRDLKEVRMSKLRKGFKVLDAGAGVKLNGVGGMEVAEIRGFVGGMVDGLRYVYCHASPLTWAVALTRIFRRINRSREESRKEREAEERENGIGSSSYQDYDDDDMQL